MKPICDMDEYASVVFRLPLITPRSPPSTIVTMPVIRINAPQLPCIGSTSSVTSRMPKMPVLLRIADRSAVAGAGASV